MRLLVAEDERDFNEIIVQKLKSEGYSVDACYDGAEAMDILSYTEYDVVLLDIMMPKADGYQVLAALRASGKETPVLFLTARDAIEDRVKGLDSGACGRTGSKSPGSPANFAWKIHQSVGGWRSDCGLWSPSCNPWWKTY